MNPFFLIVLNIIRHTHRPLNNNTFSFMHLYNQLIVCQECNVYKCTNVQEVQLLFISKIKKGGNVISVTLTVAVGTR